jgi:hypothetical protein
MALFGGQAESWFGIRLSQLDAVAAVLFAAGLFVCENSSSIRYTYDGNRAAG